MNYSFLKGTLQPTHDLLGNVSDFITLLVRASHRNQEVTGWFIAYLTSYPQFNMVQFIYNFIFELNYIMGWHWKHRQYGINQLADSFDSVRVLCNGPILRKH